MANKFLTNINLTAGLEASGNAGASGQILQTTGTGVTWVDPSSFPADSAERVVVQVKNTSGGILLKGTPVYMTGTVGATDVIQIAAADAASSSTMPATGILAQDLAINASGEAVVSGLFLNVPTSPIDGLTPVANDTIYVKSGGGLTLTKPTGSNLIQNIGKVGKVSAGNAGSIVVSSILRTNDVPNLPLGRLFVGTNANTSLTSDVVYIDDANSRVGIGTSSPSAKLHVYSGLSGATANTNADDFVIESNTNAGISILGDGNETQYLMFGDSANSAIGRLVYNHTDNSMGLFTNATERMRITSGGNVGIGTASPSRKLTIGGIGNTGDGLKIEDPTNTAYGAHLTYYDAGSEVWLGGITNNIYNQTLSIHRDATRTITVDVNNNVGIGTVSPNDKLDVFGDFRVSYDTSNYFTIEPISNGNVYFKPTGGSIHMAKTTKNNQIFLYDYTAATTRWGEYDASSINLKTSTNTTGILLNTDGNSYINNGNVGIGTTSPSEKLDVAGNAIVRGDIVSRDTYPSIYVDHSGTAMGGIRADATNKLELKTLTTAPLSFQVNSSEKMRILDNGNVGIGVTGPTAKLHIVDTSGANIILNSNTGAGNNGIWMTEGGVATPYTNGAYFHYDSSANLVKLNTGTTTLLTRFVVQRDTGKFIVGGADTNQTQSLMNSRQNGSSIEFGHLNQSGQYYGTLGAMSSSGSPFIAFSADNSNSNSFTTRGAKGFVISQDTGISGDLIFSSVPLVNTADQSLVERMRINSAGAIKFNAYSSTNQTGTPTYLLGTDASGNVVKTNTVPGSGAGPYLPLAGGTMTGNIVLDDNVFLDVGADSDLRIYHNGTNNFILNTVGNLNIRNTADDGNINFQADDGSGGYTNYFIIAAATEQTQVYKDFRFQDSVKAKFGSSSDLNIYHDGSNSYITDSGTGDLRLSTNGTQIQLLGADGTENMVRAVNHGTVELYYDNSKKFETTSTGVTVTGSAGISIQGTNATGAESILIQGFASTDTLGSIRTANTGGYNQDMRFYTSNVIGQPETLALTLDASQNATFAGTVTATSGIFSDVATLETKLNGNDSALNFTTASGDVFRIGLKDSDNTFRISKSSTSLATNTYLTIDSSGNATFAGDISAVNANITTTMDVGSFIYVGGNNSIFAENNLKFKSAGPAYIDHNTSGQSLKFRLSNSSSLDVIPLEITPSYMASSVDMYFGDNDKIRLGASSDLQIYHDGSHSYINGSSGAGSLYIRPGSGGTIQLETTGGSDMMTAGSAAVTLYSGGVEKLATTSTGVTVTGAATATTFLGDLNGTINTATTAVTKANATNDTTVATTAFVQNLIGTIPAGLVFQGTWNAATNTPTLTSGTGTTGNFYIVSVDGSTNLDGITDWKVGDWAVFVEQGASDQWEKVDNSSVLDGSGTGGIVTGWAGSGTSNTLTNSPITFSGNDITVPGNISITSGSPSIYFNDTSGSTYNMHVRSDQNRFEWLWGGGIKFGVDSSGILRLSQGYQASTSGLTEGSLIMPGKLGIGTDSPENKLHVQQSGLFTGIHNTAGIRIKSDGASAIGNYHGTLALSKGTGSVAISAVQEATDGDVMGMAFFTHPSATGGDAATEQMRIDQNGNVGIGTTNPNAKLAVRGSGLISQDFFHIEDSGGVRMLEVNSDAAGNAYLQIKNTSGSTNNVINSAGNSYFNGGNVGIGTTSPGYKLSVAGGISAGGKLTYTKSTGSLDTTGYDVAGLTTSTNGQSAGFTFTCFGHSGGYQKIVYSCYNSGGNWYASKVIDEGTNQLDVVASANSTTITFTFKSISGTMSYTPRVTVEAVGTAINSTYA